VNLRLQVHIQTRLTEPVKPAGHQYQNRQGALYLTSTGLIEIEEKGEAEETCGYIELA